TGPATGTAIRFKTQKWTRAASLGDELDVVLAAALSPDGTTVVSGGPSRVVKLVANPGGQVIHSFHKPTDWVTAARVSPDGLLVAAGDRFSGVFLWAARSGQGFLTLRGRVQ